MSVELIVTGVALASACILLAHAIEAYRGHQRARDRSPIQYCLVECLPLRRVTRRATR